MNHLPLIAVAAAATALLVALLIHAIRRRRPELPVRARPVMTRAEIAFHHHLVAATARVRSDLAVLSQVSMCAFIETRHGLDDRTRMMVRNKFNRKVVDFVLIDAAANVVLIIELDDRTHDADRDAGRDAITSAAGLATLRIRGRDARDQTVIEQRLREKVGRK